MFCIAALVITFSFCFGSGRQKARASGLKRYSQAQRRFLVFSMNEKLKLSVVCGSLRPGFLLLLRRSRFVGKEIKILI